MKRSFWLAAAVVAGIGMSAADARAQALSVAEPNTVTVTPFLSASFGTSQGADNSIGIGGAVGYDLTRHLGFEFEVGRVFDVAGDTPDLDWSLTNFSTNVVYHFAAPRITPYAAAGLGWENSDLDADENGILDLDARSSTEIAWNFGGGVKYPINERIIARADLRRFQVNDVAPDHWRFYGGLTFWIKR
jgi:opacity protein-like surface antigen